jgi:hypothetical protein
MKKVRIIFICVFFLVFESGVAQNMPQTIAFYATASDAADANIISMTQDFFYTQLIALNTYKVLDRRDVAYSDSIASSLDDSDTILFYAEIMQNGAGWDCTLYAKYPAANAEAKNSRYYDSFYRVFTDAKISLGAVLQQLEPQEQKIEVPAISNETIPTLEGLAGTWFGEPNADKIQILRGGRGFIIYKNGATMGISVSLEGNEVIITQRSKKAPPVKWTFRLSGSNTLIGVKETVRPAQEEAVLDALWERD